MNNKDDKTHGAFTFYESFWRSIKCLPEAERGPFVIKLVEYGIEDKITGGTPTENALLAIMRPLIDKSHERYKEGQQWKELNKVKYKLKHSQENRGSEKLTALDQKGNTSQKKGTKGIDPRIRKLPHVKMLDELTPEKIQQRITADERLIRDKCYKYPGSAPVYTLTLEDLQGEIEYLKERLAEMQ